MLEKIKNLINFQLNQYFDDLDTKYSLNKLSPLLFNHIKDFTLRDGKRIRPILFITGYTGFSKKIPPNLYKTAVSIELIHDFMLVHDDIIDKSDKRRGKPTMHKMFEKYLKEYKNIKFNGKDLSIISGDIMLTMAVEAFMAVKEDSKRKERALMMLMETATFTGYGQFNEVFAGIKDIEQITRKDIFKIYDLKTAYYTFSGPLAIGATLAGAPSKEVSLLYNLGVSLGRAFQIKDDILGLLGEKRMIGKSIMTDLQESKRTLVLWHLYRHSNKENKIFIRDILNKRKVTKNDFNLVREMIKKSDSLNYTKKQINKLVKNAQTKIRLSRIKSRQKTLIINLAEEIIFR